VLQVLSKKNVLLNSKLQRFIPVFSSKSFILLAFVFKFLIDFESFLNMCKVCVQFHSFVGGFSAILAAFVQDHSSTH
jgi:hypothetical protein